MMMVFVCIYVFSLANFLCFFEGVLIGISNVKVVVYIDLPKSDSSSIYYSNLKKMESESL